MIRRRLRPMRVMILLVVVLVAPLGMRAATSPDVSPLLDQVKRAVAQNDYEGAMEALQTVLEHVRQAAPLTAKPFLLVAEPATFYGGYLARKDAVVLRGEPLYFYLEPKNLVVPRTDQGQYEPAFSIDLQILSAAGDILVNQEGFGAFRFASQSPLQDIFVNLQVTLTGAPAGNYQIRFIVRDAHSVKTATVTQPITVQ